MRPRRGVRARVQSRPIPGRLGRARVPGRLVGAVAGLAAQDGGLAAAARRGLVAGPEGADAAPEVASPKPVGDLAASPAAKARVLEESWCHAEIYAAARKLPVFVAFS